MNPQPAHFTAILCGLFIAIGIAGSPALRSLLQPVPVATDWAAWEASINTPPQPETRGGREPDTVNEPRESSGAVESDRLAEDGEGTTDDEVAALVGPDVEPRNPEPSSADEREWIEPTPVSGIGVLLAPGGRCGFAVNDLEVGRAVRRRQVIDTPQPFESNGAPVFAWFDVTNRDRDLDTATVRWNHTESGHLIEEQVDIRVGSHWRFYVEQPLPPLLLGNWRMELVDEADCVVGSAGFDMLPMGWAESED
jgi:hypothetical protein